MSFLYGVSYSRQTSNINLLFCNMFNEYLIIFLIFDFYAYFAGRQNTCFHLTYSYLQISEWDIWRQGLSNPKFQRCSKWWNILNITPSLEDQFSVQNKVTLLDTKLVPDIKPDYIPLSILSSTKFDQDYLADKFICNSYLWFFFLLLFVLNYWILLLCRYLRSTGRGWN